MSQQKTHWKKLVNPVYLGAYSLDPGEERVVTIDKVVREMVVADGGKKEECTVAHLRGEKPFILNITNSKSIAGLYGNFIEDWAGKQITIFATTTRMAGDTVECLRIRAKVPEKRKEKMSKERLAAGLAAISKGEYTAERMRKSFLLTPEQEQELQKHIEFLVSGGGEQNGTVSDQGERAESNNDGAAEEERRAIAGSEDAPGNDGAQESVRLPATDQLEVPG